MRTVRSSCRTPIAAILRSCPRPRHELVQACGGPEIDELGQHVGKIGLRVDAVQFARLCRIPNYAERTGGYANNDGFVPNPTRHSFARRQQRVLRAAPVDTNRAMAFGRRLAVVGNIEVCPYRGHKSAASLEFDAAGVPPELPISLASR